MFIANFDPIPIKMISGDATSSVENLNGVNAQMSRKDFFPSNNPSLGN